MSEKKHKHFHVFLGVKTDDMSAARLVCERFVGQPMRCAHSTYYGGDHCDVDFSGGEFCLRLNHHDDGGGWSWCLENQAFPFVLSCSFSDAADAPEFMDRVKDFYLLEWVKGTEVIR
jgi:hypothetical protein